MSVSDAELELQQQHERAARKRALLKKIAKPQSEKDSGLSGCFDAASEPAGPVADPGIAFRRVMASIDELEVPNQATREALRQSMTDALADGNPRHIILTGTARDDMHAFAKEIAHLYGAAGIFTDERVMGLSYSSIPLLTVEDTQAEARKRLSALGAGGVVLLSDFERLVSPGCADLQHFQAVKSIIMHLAANNGQMAMIVAGTREETEAFLATSPVVARRFTCVIDFDDRPETRLSKKRNNLRTLGRASKPAFKHIPQ